MTPRLQQIILDVNKQSQIEHVLEKIQDHPAWHDIQLDLSDTLDELDEAAFTRRDPNALDWDAIYSDLQGMLQELSRP